MKRLLPVVIIGIVVLFVACYFIPIKREKQVFVANTFQNIINSVSVPNNWLKWNQEAMAGWQKDSAHCTITQDSAQHIFTIALQDGKNIKVTQLNALLYQVECITNKQTTAIFGFTIVPFVGNNQQQSQHNSRIAYAYTGNLLYYLLPFLAPQSFADKTMEDLRTYMESNLRFYGYHIVLKQTTNTIFVTQNENCKSEDVYNKLPTLFNNLQNFAQKKQVSVAGLKNVAYTFLNNDSVYVVAGININKLVEGEFVTNIMQFPPTQIQAVGHFEGLYKNRLALYKAMQAYLTDHQLQLIGACYEQYLSPLPTNENDSIKIDLCYPLRQY